MPGALNEHYSDVFGMMVDTANWTIGENTVYGVMRNISNPPSESDSFGTLTFVHPDHMDDYLTEADLKVEKRFDSGVWTGNGNGVCDTGEQCMVLDSGGIHINCGIPNKAAYLLTQGGVHGGVAVQGIGRAKVAQLYYDVLTTPRLTSSANFMDARNSSLTQAMIYYLKGLWSQSNVSSVANAFAAVGLGEGDADGDMILDGTESDADNDFRPDGDDNCPLVANPAQTDTDNDGLGDACDPDSDNDSVLNITDNCPLAPNPDQLDNDLNGIGSACDDEDHDGHPANEDNCTQFYNPDQLDTDGDGQGNTCDPDDDNDGRNDGQDNCLLHPNPDQTDSDDDTLGDACDLCPGVSNSDNGDPDGDGLGNPCDTDDDNDGVLDAVDNCRVVSNPDQVDLDENGIGLACDDNEEAMLRDRLNGWARWDDPVNWPILRIPIGPCGNCPDWLSDRFQAVINVILPLDLPVRIVDEMGDLVAAGGPGLQKTLTFYPSPQHHYRCPLLSSSAGQATSGDRRAPDRAFSMLATSAQPAYRGLEYYLEIEATGGVQPGQAYPIQVDVARGTGARIYLPVVVKGS